jgi:hypothetical protein
MDVVADIELKLQAYAGEHNTGDLLDEAVYRHAN